MNATWTKVSAGHYRTTDGQFEAIKESDNTGWSLYEGSRRAAFVGTYKQCRDEVANRADAPATPAAPKVRKPGLTSVTHTDGTISTRKSKTNTYTHAVVLAPAAPEAYAAGLLARAATYTETAAKLRRAAADGKVRIESRGFRTQDNMVSYQATLIGTDRATYTWCSADGMTKDYRGDMPTVTPVVPYLIASAEGSADRMQEQAAELTAQAAEVTAAGRPVGEYLVLRWSSRRDLAERAVSEFDGYRAKGHRLAVVAVD